MLPVSLDCRFLIAPSDTEEAIKNRQSRETGNIEYTRRIQTKQKHNNKELVLKTTMLMLKIINKLT
jgi:hypothetical protein